MRTRRPAGLPALLPILALVVLVSGCGGYDTGKAKAMTCSEFAQLNPAVVASQPTSKQSDIIKALLRDRKLDDGVANVELGYTNLTLDCGIGGSGNTTNPNTTLGALAATWQGQ